MNYDFKHILSTYDISRDQAEFIIQTAKEFEPYAKKLKSSDQLKGKVMASLFYEPSTRTRLSFETAMLRLGGQVISVTDPKMTAIAKGESWGDTANMMSQFTDVIVVRHPQVGVAKEFAATADIPVLNGGDGVSQHPTQALLDLYTIQQECGKIDGLTIAMSGDLKHGRTASSLAILLTNFNVKFKFIAPKELAMKQEVKDLLKAKEISFEETENLEEGIVGVDIIYMTRIQKERFENPSDYEKFKGTYILDRKLIEEKNPNVTVMHPLPRVNEIHPDVDDLPNAAYFRQAGNGVTVRMALLSLVLQA
jgi:aspartate carbamoyltransferase catalytic subunit